MKGNPMKNKKMRLLGLLVLFLLVLSEGAGAQEVLLPKQARSPVPAERIPQAEPNVHLMASGWTIEWVDQPKSFGNMGDRSLALDSAGHPHFAYGGDALYYAWHDGTTWHQETVDASYYVGGYTSLDLDAAGRPHISYYDGFNGDLKYAHYDGTTWQTQTIDSPGDVGRYTSLALDGADHPHISYCVYNAADYTCDGLKYAHWNGTAWQIQTVDGAAGAGLYTSLDIDWAGQPHIGYYAKTSGELKYAWYDGTTWQIQTVISVSVGQQVSLALDGNARPHISYFDWGGERVMYAHHDGTTWQVSMIDAGDYVSWAAYNSLALDSAGRPHVAYSIGWPDDALKYAYYDGTYWQIEILESGGAVGRYISLALDSADRAHLSYFNQITYELRYAFDSGTSWQIEIVDRVELVGESSSLALDAADHPHISYLDSTDRTLLYAHHDGSAWQIEELDTYGSDLGWADTSLALDTAGRPRIAYLYYGTIKYAYHDGSSWQIETVLSGAMPGVSLALDAAGQPHISYLGDWDTLRYAHYDGSSWHTETVDSDVSGGASHSLALDTTGRPHIAYLGGGFLKHAWHDGTAWQIETAANGGGGISLALDAADRPHIGYEVSEALTYVHYDGTSWVTETLDTSDYMGSISLALDGAGLPHIGYSYYDGSTRLKYAHYDGVTWQIETVDGPGSVGHYNSLALDAAGLPHVSYVDHAIDDLKYAYRTCMPVSSVTISGPASLEAGEVGTYTATPLPPTANQPVTLSWDNGTVGDTASYSWDQPGTYTIVATAVNSCGQAQGHFVVEVAAPCQAVEGLEIGGPTRLPRGIAGLYAASYSPPTATLPTITWDNGTTGGTASYSWVMTGTYTLAATATNDCSSAQDSFSVEVFCQALEGVEIGGPAVWAVDQPVTFRASPQPITASIPITFSWDNGTTGPEASYSWPATGTYTLTVTATNVCEGVQVASWQVQVLAEWPYSIFLPLVMRE